MSSTAYHLYTISFTVSSEAGIALVAAQDDKSAFQILKNGGSRHSEGYSLIQCRDIGMTANCHYGLLMESFVNAKEAYDAIVSVANMLKGETGQKGDKGDTGPIPFDSVNVTVDDTIENPHADSEITTDALGQKILNIAFGGIKGIQGASISSVTQTVVATEDGSNNEITITLENGASSRVYVKNGTPSITSATATVDGLSGVPRVFTGIDAENKQLSFSFYGLKGAQGEPGVNNTIQKITEDIEEEVPSADTMNIVFLQYNEDTDEYDRYITEYNGSTYEFVQISSTAVDLSDYKRADSEVWLTQDEFDAILIKDATKTYNIYEDIETPESEE